MRKVSVILFLVWISLCSSAQDIHFSQFSNSTFFLNPALLSFHENENNISLQRRSQWASVTKPFKTNVFSFERKNIFHKHSLGVQFLNDFAGDSEFSTNGINLMYSKLVLLNQKSFLSLAISSGFFERSITFNNLIFFEQEQLSNVSLWFYDLTFGIATSYSFNPKFTLISSTSVYHVNKPNISLINNESITLESKLNFAFISLYNLNSDIMFSPKVFVSSQGKAAETIIFFDVERNLVRKKNTKLFFGGGVRLKDAVIFRFGTQIGQVKFITSYDINNSSFVPATNYRGALELLVSYSWDTKIKNKPNKRPPCPKYL